MKRLLMTLVLFALAPASSWAAVFNCVSASACASAPCDWAAADSWTSCNGTYPANGAETFTARVHPGHTVKLSTDGITIGDPEAAMAALTVVGTLEFDTPAGNRDAQGFSTLTLLPASTGAALTMSGTGAVLDIPASHRLFTDTSIRAATNTLSGTVEIRGNVAQTPIDAVAAKTADARCGAEGYQQYVVVTVEHGEEVAKVGRRILFLDGQFRNRQFEIVSVSGQDIGFCTYLPDAAPSTDVTCDTDTVTRSCGQRLTPHVTVGTFPDATPSPNRRHWTPAPEPANAVCTGAFAPMTFCTGTGAGTGFALYPAAGDSVAIIDDVWLGDPSAAQNGVTWQMLFSPKMPHLYAVNIFGGSGLTIQSQHLGTETPQDIEYINWHDPSTSGPSPGSFHVGGFKDYAVRHSAFHDDGSGSSAAYGTLSPGCWNATTGPCGENVQITDNVFYRSLGNQINFLSAGITMVTSGVKVLRNLVYEGCSTFDALECRGIEVNNCRNCDIMYNVLHDIVTRDDANDSTLPNGDGIRSGSPVDAPSNNSDGMAVAFNWIVNTGYTGIALNSTNGFAGQGTGVTANYVANVGRHFVLGGNLYGNVFRNNSMMATHRDGTVSIKSGYGNMIIGNDAAQSGTCAGACSASCLLVSNDGLYMSNSPDITFQDNVCAFLNSGSAKAVVTTPVDYDGRLTLSHDTFYGGQTAVDLQNLPAASSATVDMSDLTFSHLNAQPIVSCSAQAGVTDSVFRYMRNSSTVPPENTSMVVGTCSPSGTSVTPNAGIGYVDPDVYNFNLVPDAAALTGAADASALGIRAFAFDRSTLDRIWGGGLPWDLSAGDPTGATRTPFPMDICDNGTSCTDTDGDGALDFLDTCASVFNPSQFDEDGDRFGHGCDCAPRDASAWELPGEVADLMLGPDPLGGDSITRLDWPAPTGGLAASMTYDVLRSPEASDFVSSATCLASHRSGPTATDAEVPGVGSAYFYVVLARDACGPGVSHLGSDGLLLTVRDCAPPPPGNPPSRGGTVRR